MSFFCIIPSDIFKLIYNSIDVELYDSFKLVSKEWYSVFKNHHTSYKDQVIYCIQKGYLSLLKVIYHENLQQEELVYNASLYSKLEVLEWFKEKNFICNGASLIATFINGNIKILEWLETNYENMKVEIDDPRPIYRENNCKIMLEYGNIEMLEWFSKNKNYTFQSSHYLRVYRNHKQVYNYLMEMNTEITNEVMDQAINRQIIPLLQFLHDNQKLEFYKENMCKIGTRDRMELLKWARRNNYPWNDMIHYVIKEHNEHMFFWCIENGCPVDYKCFELAKEKRLNKIIEYFVTNFGYQ